MTIFPKTIIFLTLSILSACSSPPPEVSAEVSLINYENISHNQADTIPQDLWSHFNNAQVGTEFMSDYGLFQINNTYVSALGHSCLAFTLTETKVKNSTSKEFYPKDKYYSQDRRACYNNKEWFFISPIMKRNNGGVE
ncbi:MAG: hypothetical protein P8M49_00115 [Thalassotalea sp.]|nr:hypothetical protein [Thalassotalea sp.]MDG2391886.1 hypothetical protein [Thalassotalea sp.]